MKKKVFVIFLALAMIFSLCACGSDDAAAPSGSAGADKPADSSTPAGDSSAPADEPADEVQKLIVGFDAEFPPFGFIAEDGSYDGFDLAMAEELCKRLGWEFEAVPIDWTQKDNELSSGAINCIWNGFTCTGREDQYTWSDPYVDNSIVIVVKADSGIQSLADLAGKIVMAQGASSAADAINANEEFKASLAQVIELPDYNAGFMELRMGTVDAIAADLGVASFQIANNEGDYIILSEAISTEQYAVGFLLGNTALRDAVNAELKAMAEDGTMLAIAEKYVDAGLVIDSLCMIG